MGNIWKWAFLTLCLIGCGGNNDVPPADIPPVTDLGGCMSANAMLFGGSSTPLAVVDAADFDGTNDYMTRGAGLTGAVDSKKGLLSFWYRQDATPVLAQILSSSTTTGGSIDINKANDGYVYIILRNAAGTTVLYMRQGDSASFGAGATWYHILSSWDLSTSTTQFYLTDIATKRNIVGSVNDYIDYTVSNLAVGAYTNGGNKMSGCLAEFYFAPGQYLDLSATDNRRKFISATGKPVYLGADGSLPTGVAPLMYLHLDDGEAVANFATNRGTGGNFTITGTLDTATTSPSD